MPQLHQIISPSLNHLNPFDQVLRAIVRVSERVFNCVCQLALGRAYNRTKHLDERIKMMQGWADYLDQLRRGR